MTKYVFLNTFEIISNLKSQAETLKFLQNYTKFKISYTILSVIDPLT